jgi:exodeoxyribonuclease-3
MALRGKKIKALEDLRPDIAIVPECENPERLWGKQPLLAPIPMDWIGSNENKGLAVLAFNGYRITRHADYSPNLRWMLPVEVRGPVNFHLLAVWAMNHRIPKVDSQKLSGQPLVAAHRYRGFLLAGPSVVAGDFNGNVRWDKGKRATNHANTVAALEQLGLTSAYHVGACELHGKESAATLYWRDRKLDGPKYHVDYCFLPMDWCSCVSEIRVGSFDDWVASGYSDHVPLVVDVDVLDQSAAKARNIERAVRTDLV